jgi:hypothetical protein
LAPSADAIQLTPVTLPPGRLKLATRPAVTGSPAAEEDNRNLCGRGFGRLRRSVAASREDHGHLTANQIGRQGRQSIVLVLGPAVFDRHVPALNITGFIQASAKSS